MIYLAYDAPISVTAGVDCMYAITIAGIDITGQEATLDTPDHSCEFFNSGVCCVVVAAHAWIRSVFVVQ